MQCSVARVMSIGHFYGCAKLYNLYIYNDFHQSINTGRQYIIIVAASLSTHAVNEVVLINNVDSLIVYLHTNTNGNDELKQLRKAAGCIAYTDQKSTSTYALS